MSERSSMPAPVLCPSAPPEWEGSVAFGIVGGTVDAPRVGWLTEPLLVTDELLAQAAPVLPTEVFRFAAPCAGHQCSHFDGAECRLVSRTVQLLPPVVDVLPPCSLRPSCRWWQQEGRAACVRCPQVITDHVAAPEVVVQAATPQPRSLSEPLS